MPYLYKVARFIIMDCCHGVEIAGNRRRDVEEIMVKHPHKIPVSICLLLFPFLLILLLSPSYGEEVNGRD